MKKFICMFLAVLLLASLGSAAFAENTVMDFDIMGIRVEAPAELDELQGIYDFNPFGIIAHDPDVYYTSVAYYAMTEAQLEELLARSEDGMSQEDMDAYLAATCPVGIVVACEGGIENALAFFGVDDVPEDMKLHELAVVDTLHFYYLESEEAAADLATPFAEEYALVKEKTFELLQNAEFYTPVDPAGELVGQTVSFETVDLDGNPVKSSELFAENEITMINYWGTWCHNCVDEMAELAEIHTRLREKGCGLVGILQDGDTPETLELAKAIMAEKGTNYPNVLLSESMVFLEDITAFPTSFFVDREGRILTYPIAGANVEEYENVLDNLLVGETAGGLTVPTASANDADAYRITVTDSDGAPVKGVMIQFCDETTCNMGKTDDNGTVSFDMPEGVVYEVHVLKVPEGYEKNADKFRTLDVYSDLIIVIDKAA